MDAEIVPVKPTEAYRRLGKKTFWFFVINQIRAAILFLVIGVVLFFANSQSFIAQIPISGLSRYISLAGWSSIGIAIIALFITFLASWLVYRNYLFMLDDDSLKIKSGVITKDEIAIPYRQIQDVDIERSIFYQMIGVSRLVILTAGHDDAKQEDEDEGVFPALDKNIAEWLRNELLKRTNIQRVTEIKPQ